MQHLGRFGTDEELNETKRQPRRVFHTHIFNVHISSRRVGEQAGELARLVP